MKIAVIGMACRYPGANSAKELYENILSGRRSFREVPPERWSLADYYNPDKRYPDTTYCKKMALIEGFEFNPAEFRIPRSTYLATDIAQWMALKVAQEALADAGITSVNRESTAAIIGNTLTGEMSRAMVLRYRWPYTRRVIGELLDNLNIQGDLKEQLLENVERRYKAPFPPVNEDNLAGGLSNTIAGRICNFFDFKAGGFSTDGACSSSLLAINQACIGLEHGNCDLALAGGVDISLDPFELVGFAKVGALSDGDIRVYDQNSNGFLPGEGCGIVLLQRLEDAISEGRSIYAVVNGIGISSDGKGGITAPNVEGQSFAVDRAYEDAGYNFADIELIEGHGTGTPTGDNVELTTFISALSRHGATDAHRCGIGSIKSNIGHTKAAAGVAGFIKAVMSVCYSILPPTEGVRTPNNHFKESKHLYPLQTGKAWHSQYASRRAAVSSAGFGGINTHITLSSDIPGASSRSEEQERERLLSLLCSSQYSEVFLLGGNSLLGLRENIEIALTAAGRISIAEVADLSHYCAQNFTSTRVRLSFVASSPEEIDRKLHFALQYISTISGEAQIDYADYKQGVFLKSSIHQPRIAFLFSGQASQSLNMGRWLKGRSGQAAQLWQKSDEIIKERLGRPLSEYVFRDDLAADSQQLASWHAELCNTEIAQPAITTASLALCAFLRNLGVRPDVAIGHSLGEYAALCSAGALDVESTLRLVALRGQAMAQASSVPAGMLSIAASEQEVVALLQKIDAYAVISNLNAPKQTVISGEIPALNAVAQLCQQNGHHVTRLNVSGAFHSKFMQTCSETLHEPLQQAHFGRLRHLVISSMTGDFLSDQSNFSELLAQQVVNPVRFIDAINTAATEDCQVFVEVGSGSILASLTNQILEREDILICSADIGSRGQHSDGLNQLVAYLFACGVPLNVHELYSGRFLRPMNLPYQPNFITSPCEIPVAPLKLDALKDLFTTGNIDLTKLSLPQQTDAHKESKDHAALIPEDVSAEGEEAIFRMLQCYVIDTFGYSEEMVTPQARLQEHLGLDSLKSVEVAFEVMGALGVRGDIAQMGDVSLQEVAAYIHKLTLGGESSDLSPAGSSHVDSVFPNWVRAFELKFFEQALSQPKRSTVGGHLLIVFEQYTEYLELLQQRLKVHGFSSDTRYISEAVTVTDYNGCIIVANERRSLQDWLDVSGTGRQARLTRPRVLLQLSKLILGYRGVGDDNKLFVLVTEQGGYFGKHDSTVTEQWMPEAGMGFIRTLHLEQPKVQTRCIDFAATLPDDKKVSYIVDELLQGDGHVEVGYSEEHARRIAQYQLCDIASLMPSRQIPQVGDVVVVTGGAKGITAECVIRFAQDFGVKLALIGSSDPNAAGNEELTTNLSRFTQLGINYRYYSCDVLDLSRIKNVLTSIVTELGPVRGIIHAAGVNVLNKIDNLEWASFERVLMPKMEGLVNLFSAVERNDLKFVTVFSSVIANSGMSGNADYAYANEWMNQLLRRMSADYPQIDFRALGFSVWADVGMGARLNSVNLLGHMGIGAIPVIEGVDIFMQLMRAQWPDNNLIVSSRMGKLDTIDFTQSSLPSGRFLEKVLYLQPGVELIAEAQLTPELDHYLRDHNYEGSLLFPAVMGVEAMVQCSVACRMAHIGAADVLPVLENLQFSRAVIVPPQGRAIRIYVQLSQTENNGEQRAKVYLRSSVTDYKMDYFSAECVWNTHYPKIPEKQIHRNKALSLNVAKHMYGTIFFQGPMFRNIDAYLELSDQHCVVNVRVPQENRLFDTEHSAMPLYFGSGQLRDTYLHAVQACVPEYKILPVSIDRIVYSGFLDTDSAVILYAQERERTETEFLYDLHAYNKQGLCIEAIIGFRCRIMSEFTDTDTLKIIKAAHKKSRAKKVPALT